MELLEERSRTSTLITYRAVGSGTGQTEFVGSADGATTARANDFGSGDIPMDMARYDKLKAAGRTMLHVPFQLGAIAFFHSVPGGQVIDLDACLLSKIFQLQITTWDHADIMAANPSLKVPAGQKITVVRRVFGSSSTSLATDWINKACPGTWKIGAGKGNADSATLTPTKAPFWDCTSAAACAKCTGGKCTVGAQGSGGVSDALAATAYSIGYVDSGHGHKLGLSEISLKNANGKYLTSKVADIGGAATSQVLPANNADWSAVNLMNKAGDKTWPMTTFSYLYLDSNMSAYNNETAALAQAFALFILSDECQGYLPDFGFSPIPKTTRDASIAALNSIKMPAGAVRWTFETAKSTQKIVGMGAKVFSGKRQAYSGYAITHLEGVESAVESRVAALEVAIKAHEAVEDALRASIAANAAANKAQTSAHDGDESSAVDILALVVALLALAVSVYAAFVKGGAAAGSKDTEMGGAGA